LLFENPFFSFWTSAIGRWIEDYSLVFIASPGFPLDELHGVVHHPADPFQSGGFHVVLGPGHHLLHRIEVCHIRSCSTASHTCRSGVGKQVENFGFGSRKCFDFFEEVIPIDSLFRK
jgi:hypothetical protein